MKRKKVLIFGVSGMLGSSMLQCFSKDKNFITFGTVRSKASYHLFSKDLHPLLIPNINVEKYKDLKDIFLDIKPDFVINCVGLVKQLDESKNPLLVIPINSMLPHVLDSLCIENNANLIHFSTDCVFSGKKGMYKEEDFSDANDLYGRTKFLGETSSKNAITLRTSIIGHELNSSRSLVDWALSQSDKIMGYEKAIFSGLPTYELSKVVKDYVLPNKDLKGLYHVAAKPINKLELLKLVYKFYNKDIKIVPDLSVVINRSLDSSKFYKASGYKPPEWNELIKGMYTNKYGE